MGKYLAWGHDIQTRGSEVLVWWVKCFPVWPNQTQLMSIYQISTKCWKFQNFYFSLKTVKTCIKEQVHLRTFRLKFVQKSTKYTRTHSAWKKIPLLVLYLSRTLERGIMGELVHFEFTWLLLSFQLFSTRSATPPPI